MSGRFLLCLGLASFLAAYTSAVSAQTVSFKIIKPAEQIKLSETFKLRFELTAPADYEIKPDTTTSSTAAFEILDIKASGSALSGETKTGTYEISAAAFELGLTTFPALTWQLNKGTEQKTARSPEFTLEVLQLFTSDPKDTEIRDIHPPFKFIPWLWLIIMAALLTAAGYAAYRHFIKPKFLAAKAADKQDLRTSYQKASEALNELIASGLWEQSRIKEFYTGLADIFRLFLYDERGIKAESMTTNDITKELRKSGADIQTVMKTRQLLEGADLVKFAKSKPETAEKDSAIAGLKDLLLIFRKIEPEKPGEPAAGKEGKN